MRSSTIRACFRGLFEYLIAAALLLNAHTIWLNDASTRSFFSLGLLVMLALGVGGSLMLIRIRQTTLRNSALVSCLLLLAAGAFYIVNPYHAGDLFKFVLAVILLYVYNANCRAGRRAFAVLAKYRNLVVLLAALSTAVWYLATVARSLRPTGTVVMNWTGDGRDARYAAYYGLYFGVQTIAGGVWRNTSIFVEAPFAAFAFSLALLVELFLTPQDAGHGVGSLTRTAVLVIAMASTFSATAYLVIGLSLSLAMLLRVRQRSLKRLVIGLLPLCAAVLGYAAACLVLRKLSTGSGAVHLDDYRVGWEAFAHAPLFGNGFYHYDEVKRFMGSWRQHTTGLSNSPAAVMAFTGLFGTLPYALLWGRAIQSGLRDRRSTAFLGILLLLFLAVMVPTDYAVLFALLAFATGTNQEPC